MPIFFLSGALYPLNGLPPALQVLTHADPLTYGIDGVRGVLLGTSHFGVALDVGILAVVGAAFLVLGAWRFSKIDV
jgi:ABC-2 type transport system permease protein